MFALSHAGIMTGRGAAEVLIEKLWPKKISIRQLIDNPYASDRDFTAKRGRLL